MRGRLPSDADMNPHTAEENEIRPANKNVREEDLCHEQNVSKRLRKVFIPRNSLITDLIAENRVNIFLNVSISLYVFLVTYTLLYYFVAPEEFWRDMRIMRWSLTFWPVFKIWLSLNAYALLILQGFKLWARVRCKYRMFADCVALLAFVTATVSMYVATPYAVLQNELAPVPAAIALIEMVRIFMKIYACVRECAPRVLKYEPSKDGVQDQRLCPSSKYFLYFLFVPTLVYRDSYPQKQKIDWKFVGQTLFHFTSCLLICNCIHMRFGIDILSKTGQQPFSLAQAVLILAGSTAVGGILMFMLFFCQIHSWMNLGAELTRFADREFYQDWWNSKSFDEYYRKWNVYVNDWLYAYVYRDARKLGVSKNGSVLFAFALSAIVHEYFLSFSLGFFYPSLLIDFLFSSVLLLFWSRRSKSRFWNIFLWFCLFFGFGKNICLYTMEWYARVNCERTLDSFVDLFYPRMFANSCHILSYE